MTDQPGIFHEWVPKKLHLPLLLSLIAAVGLNSGVSGSASLYISGSTSAIPADVTMASYAHTIGLSLGLPLLTFTLKRSFSDKSLLLLLLIGMIVSNGALAWTDEPLILVMCSFTAGLAKIVFLRGVLIYLIPILMPGGERHRLYAIYYPVNLIAAQAGSMVVVWFADRVNWQTGHLF